MKPNELMIGDWVKIEEHKEPAYILSLERDKAWIQGKYQYPFIPYDKISPIPLTKEILKANGFVMLYTNTTSLVEYDGYVILTKNQGDNMYNFAGYGHYKICIMYVHELQHALRLCGLTELADNFKVND